MATPACGPFRAQHRYSAGNDEIFVTDDYTGCTLIGRGGYGIVCKATHTSTGEEVAIKQTKMPIGCLPKPPHPLSEFEIVASRTLREIRILQFLGKHLKASSSPELLSHFIELRDILQMRTKDVNTVCTVTQLLPGDLASVFKNLQSPLSIQHVQCIMYNLLRAVKYLHSAKIAHRDIKPQNILINDACHVVLCDFGLAREIAEGEELTSYIVTRYYRAPELLMDCKMYDEKVDIWSLGCVLAELLMPYDNRNPLWKGKHTKDQLDLILTTLGVPPEGDVVGMGSAVGVGYVNAMRRCVTFPKTSMLAQRLPHDTDPNALDLLSKMLSFVPSQRPSAEDCLAHPFFSGGEEDVCVDPVCPERYLDEEFDFVYDVTMSSRDRVKKLKDMLYDEMLKFHPELVGYDP